MHPAALKMSPPDARTAVPQERMRRRVREKCSLLSAVSAVRNARFPSSPPKARLFIAASALLLKEQTRLNPFNTPKRTTYVL